MVQGGYGQEPPRRPWGMFIFVTIIIVLLIAVIVVTAAAGHAAPIGYPYYGYWFFFPLGFLLTLFIILAVARLLFWPRPWRMGRRLRYMNDPVYILRQRYARGEITKEQFDQMMKDLRDSQPDR